MAVLLKTVFFHVQYLFTESVYVINILNIFLTVGYHTYVNHIPNFKNLKLKVLGSLLEIFRWNENEIVFVKRELCCFILSIDE